MGVRHIPPTKECPISFFSGRGAERAQPGRLWRAGAKRDEKGRDKRGKSSPRKHPPTLKEHRSTKSLDSTGSFYVMWPVPPEILI